MKLFNNVFNRGIEQIKKNSNINTSKEAYDLEISSYSNYLKLAQKFESSMLENNAFKEEILALQMFCKAGRDMEELKNAQRKIKELKNEYIKRSLIEKNNQTYKIIDILNNMKSDYDFYDGFQKINLIKNIDDVEMNIIILDNAILLIQVSDDYQYQTSIFNQLK